MEELLRSLALFQPELALTAGLLLVVVVDSIGGAWRNARRALAVRRLAGARARLRVQPAGCFGASGELFSGMLALDPLGRRVQGDPGRRGAADRAGLQLPQLARARTASARASCTRWCSSLTLSSLLLAAANDVVMLYLALEMVSITSYVMVAYLKGDRMSNEASLKYVLFGAASTGAMLYGLSLLYGMTGTTSLPAIQQFLAGRRARRRTASRSTRSRSW